MAQFASFIALALAVTSGTAFVAPVRRHANVVRMTAENEGVDRRAFGAAVLSTLTAGAAFVPNAEAKAGQGAKFSLFGLLGNGDSYSEGAAYGSDQSQASYSPYSPFQPTNDASLANDNVKANLQAYYKILLESERRLDNNIEKPISRKQWGEVTTELDRYLYSLRKAMNGLASTPESKAAAVKFYQSIEALNGACITKNQDLAFSSYAAAVANLDAYKSLIVKP